MLTHPAFEKAIDENPLDSTNHLVYADWHDEQGQHDEAAFRRSMGEWMRTLPFSNTHLAGHSDYDIADPSYGDYPIKIGQRTNLPHGVPREFEHTPPHGGPGEPHVAGYYRSTDRFGFQTYRGMEEAFRRSFMNARHNHRMSRNRDTLIVKFATRRDAKRYSLKRRK